LPPDVSQFKGILELLVPLVIRESRKARDISEEEAFNLLYSSFLYSKLEDVIDLFKRYDMIDYIKSYYDALHVMGRLVIAADINNLVDGIRGRKDA
jgi:hypothetical protein